MNKCTYMQIKGKSEEENMKKNAIVGQSGGPTAVINGSLYGVVSEGLRQTEKIGQVYGMINGIEGFLTGHCMDIGALILTA